MSDSFSVRPFEAGDRQAYLDLCEQALSLPADDEWFDWKYANNPYVDTVSILVAVDGDDDLVGARSFFALDMSGPTGTTLALQPCDSMVHEDHRRQGLFSRLVEVGVEHYAERGVDFFFNFPNHRSLPANLKFGWERVQSLPTYYRIENPAALLSATLPDPVAKLGSVAADGYATTRKRLTGFADDSVTVESYATVPAETLSALVEPPRRLRMTRDETFYEWRFRNPLWSYRTFVALRSGAPVASIVAASRTGGSSSVVKLVDCLPITPDSDDVGALATLVERVVETYDPDLFKASDDVLPPRLLGAYGFHSDQRLPLSKATSSKNHVARPLAGDWSVLGCRLRDASDWQLSLAAIDSN